MTRNVIFMDLDGTLIRTKSNRVFPRDYNDWILNSPVIDFIVKYKMSVTNPILILVTNQMGIERGHVNSVDFALKLKNIEAELPFKIDIVIVADTAKSEFRKPNVSGINSKLRDLGINLSSRSIMIGDAGGRKSPSGKKLDFSDSDYQFAKNLGVNFVHAIDCRDIDHDILLRTL